jgi:hypothetical protein
MHSWHSWALAAAGTCLFAAATARADDVEKAAELKALLNKRDDLGVRKFFEGLKPADRKGVIREYAKEEVLDKALDKLQDGLKKAFGDIDDPEKSVKPFALYLNTILKGMKDKDGISYRDRALYVWAAKEGRNIGKAVPPGKKAAMKAFFAELGIKSGKDYERMLAQGQPKEALEWHQRFMDTFTKNDTGVSDQLFLVMVFAGD